jgi:hypothetical protein
VLLRTDQPEVRSQRHSPLRNPAVAAGFQQAQELDHFQQERNVADLGPGKACRRSPPRSGIRQPPVDCSHPVKALLLVTDEFALEQGLGQARAAVRDARPFGSRHAVDCAIVDQARREFLGGAGLAEQNDAGGLRRDAQEKFAPMKESFLPKAFPIVRLQAATCAKIPPLTEVSRIMHNDEQTHRYRIGVSR